MQKKESRYEAARAYGYELISASFYYIQASGCLAEKYDAGVDQECEDIV